MEAAKVRAGSAAIHIQRGLRTKFVIEVFRATNIGAIRHFLFPRLLPFFGPSNDPKPSAVAEPSVTDGQTPKIIAQAERGARIIFDLLWWCECTPRRGAEVIRRRTSQ